MGNVELLVLELGLEVNPSVPMGQELYPVQKKKPKPKPWNCRRWERFGTVTELRIYLELKVSKPGKWSCLLQQYLSREMGSFRSNSELPDNISQLRLPKAAKSFYNYVFSVNLTDYFFFFEIRGCSQDHA